MFNFEDKVIPLDSWITQFIDWLVEGYRWFFQGLKFPVEFTLSGLEHGLTALHPFLVIAIISLIAWRVSGIRLAIVSALTLVFIGMLGFWEDTMITLAMVFSSVVFCTIVGIPLGIASGRSDRFESILRPVLDGMQTTPAFVYLVPIVMLFSIGNVAGVLATIVFALPPIIRLTALGIRQVHPELVEAPGLWSHPFPGSDKSADSTGSSHHYGRSQPDNYDGAFNGRHCRSYRRRRARCPGCPRP